MVCKLFKENNSQGKNSETKIKAQNNSRSSFMESPGVAWADVMTFAVFLISGGFARNSKLRVSLKIICFNEIINTEEFCFTIYFVDQVRKKNIR